MEHTSGMGMEKSLAGPLFGNFGTRNKCISRDFVVQEGLETTSWNLGQA